MVGDLTKLGYKEISVREFENGRENVTTRSQMQELKAGDEFFVNGQRHMEKGKIFVVTETGWDCSAVPFVNVKAFSGHKKTLCMPESLFVCC